MAIIERKPVRDGKQDPNGESRWLVRIDVADAETGARTQRVIGTYGGKRQALKAEREALTLRDKGTLVDPSHVTIGELLDSWLASKVGSVSPNSLHDYEIVVRKHLKPALGGIRAQALTAARVQRQYTAWREGGLSARLIRGCHMRLSQALKQAQRHGLVLTNVCDTVQPPRTGRATVQTWNAQEVAAFLHTAANRPILYRGGDSGRREPDSLWPLWPLLVLEGLRRGEGLGVRWRDLDLDRGLVSVTQVVVPDKGDRGRAAILPRAKTASGARTVRLTPQTLEALRAHRAAQNELRLAATDWIDHDLIVCTDRGTPVNPGNVIRSFEALVKATRLPDGAPLRRIRVHDLRHTSATLLMGAGVPAKIVSERLGHASVAITLDLYSHVSGEMQAEAAAKMGDLLAGASGSA